MKTFFRWTTLFFITLTMTAVCSLAQAAKTARSFSSEPRDGYETVDMFQAMKTGDVQAQLIPKDATQATLLLTNKTKKPLAIRLPEAFAGVPVLAQFAPPLGPGGRNGFNPGNGFGPGRGLGPGAGGGNQGIGVGGGIGGNQGFGPGLGNGPFGRRGFFNVGPGKVGKVKLPAVCLEHGKPDPNPRIAYGIVPIESFTERAEVVHLVKMLGQKGPKYQNAIQAAVWNAQNGLSWEQLARKNRIQRRHGYSEKWFSRQELAFAKRVLKRSMERGKENSKSGKETSLSR